MSNKTILITGCSSGIGRALAEAYLTQGFFVYASARNTESLNDLKHERLSILGMDVNSSADIEKAVAHITNERDSLDILINNAGYAAMGPIAELDTERLHQQFATNVYAPIALTRACLPLLRAAATSTKKAQVVNIGSVSGILTTPFSGAYCATKAALHSISDALRMELKPFNIDVITVQPGAIQSKFGDNSLASLDNLIAADSIYAPLKPYIQARATASQDNPTPANEFAAILVNALAHKPKAVIRIGNGSTALPFMKRWLPINLLDKILGKKFGLLGLK